MVVKQKYKRLQFVLGLRVVLSHMVVKRYISTELESGSLRVVLSHMVVKR